MNSLKGRLHFGLSSALLVVMVIVWAILSASLDHIAEEIIQSRMEHDAEALLASLEMSDSGEYIALSPHITHIYERIFSGHYFTIKVNDQTIRSRSLWDQTLQQPKLAVGESLQAHAEGPQDQYLLLWSATYERFGSFITITVAEDVSSLYDYLRQFNIAFAVGALIILSVLLLVQGRVVNRTFRRVDSVRDELELLANGEIESLSEQVPNEIRPMVDEVNRLLHLLTQRLVRSRNAMGNLAHSLKHPLNLLMQLADQEQLKQHNELSEELRNNTQQIYQLMERELKRARLAGTALPGQRFAVAQEVADLIEVLKRVYREKDLTFDLSVEEGVVYLADRNDMLELIGNILDNACKWSKTLVMINIYQDQGLHIVVEDDGPGCDSSQLASLTERGTRIDESVDGSGLGLSIVKDIVQLYQGSINFKQSEQLAGLKVDITLPM